MKYSVTKEFIFDSAHQLPGKETYGKCSNIHGHTYHLFVTVGSNELKDGMVINFAELKSIVNEIIEELDHKFLNETPMLNHRVTTCENMSESIFNQIKVKLGIRKNNERVKLLEVKLYETPTSYGTYKEE